MRNISFANPYLLLIAVPLLLAVVVPYAIAIRRDNRSRSVIASLVAHIVIVLCVSLAASGLTITKVMTKTQVLVVADTSFSTAEMDGTIDEYVATVKDNLPTNSELGLICFGKDNQMLAPFGTGRVPSVSTATVDDSATDIISALNFAASQFEDESIKRIVLITDAMMTDGSEMSDFIDTIDKLYKKGIQVDAMYLDTNLDPDAKEVQISAADTTATAYLNHESTVDVLVRSSFDTQAIVTLYLGDEEIEKTAIALTQGFNIVNFGLHTSVAGDMQYRVEIDADGDELDKNNAALFTQTVCEDLKVLLISSKQEDLDAATALYGDRAVIDAYIKPVAVSGKKTPEWVVPCTIEEMCAYDEIMISNADVREFFGGRNGERTSFIQSLEKAVSLFGKSLVVIGDTQIQNKTDDILKSFEDMLPVKYGNNVGDPKLYGIVIDISRSMYQANRFEMAKTAAIYLLSLLSDEDYVCVVTVAATSEVLQHPIPASERNTVARKIAEITSPVQGTCLSAGLKNTYDEMIKMDYEDMQVMLISDGMSFTDEATEAWDNAENAYNTHGIITSCINTYCTESDGIDRLNQIAVKGHGTYYNLEREGALEDLIFSSVADEMTETVIRRESKVNINRHFDSILNGIASLESVNGFICSKAKASATVPVTVDYIKNENAVVEVPLYAYWNYGNGKVTCFTSQISGSWVSGWGEDTEGEKLLDNILTANTPEEKVDYAYTVNAELNAGAARVELTPAVIHTNANVKVTLTSPSGDVTEASMVFANAYYYYEFDVSDVGEYKVHVDYSYGAYSFDSDTSICNSYLPEYDAFAVRDAAVLHSAIRHRGNVTSDGSVDLEINEEYLTTYKASYVIPLLIIAVSLFVIDIIIRKIKWADIKSLFKATGGAK